MEKIYLKLTEAARAKITNVYELLKKGFNASGGYFKTTYDDPECEESDEQCHEASRSFGDLLIIAQTYFPRTTAKQLAEALVKYSKEVGLGWQFCGDVNKIVFWPNSDYKGNNLFEENDNEYDMIGEDDWSMELIYDLVKEKPKTKKVVKYPPIYFDVPGKYKTIYGLLKLGFRYYTDAGNEKHEKQFIKTYSDKKLTVLQSKPAFRSFSDLLAICQTYFPGTTETELALVLERLARNEGVYGQYCNLIDKPVFAIRADEIDGKLFDDEDLEDDEIAERVGEDGYTIAYIQKLTGK
jgi:hypothetical protein